MNRYILATLLLLALPLPATSEPISELLIEARTVGNLMGQYMCEEVIKTGSLNSGSEIYQDQFFEALSLQYGQDQAEAAIAKLETAFNEPASRSAQDVYIQDLFRTVFQHILDDDPCFQAFLENEVLQ